MRSIRLENVTKTYRGEVIFENLNLTIPSGKIFALLGPSGSGKTTILRLIAGFETVDSGHIYLGNREITDVPINQRRVNTVFQNYALFPHLNVFDNVAFSQRIKHLPTDVIEEKVIKVLKTVHLEKHTYKSIQQLSGGQQQRVALARAIINEPDVLLLDEPLAALDPQLRDRMLLELIDLQSALKTTFVYVTHDQTEALTVADYMAILNEDGIIEQVGTPKDIYEFPSSSFVAQFVGITNLLTGHLIIKAGQPSLESEIGICAIAIPEGKSWTEMTQLFMSLRPEKIDISKTPLAGFANTVQGIVTSIMYQGSSTHYNVRVGEKIIQVFEQNEEHFAKDVIDYDDTVYLQWQKENAVLLER